MMNGSRPAPSPALLVVLLLSLLQASCVISENRGENRGAQNRAAQNRTAQNRTAQNRTAESPGSTASTGTEPAVAQQQLFPVTIVFEPALSATGTLSVRHESGWAVEVAAPPSGVDLAVPEGPASLLLVVGARQFERTLKVAPRSDGNASSCVWRMPQ